MAWLRAGLGFLALATSVAAADPVGLDALDLRYLPQLRVGRAHLASSTDPTGGNGDRGHYLRQNGSRAVLMEADGPGLITRIWSANPQGQLQLYFDDDEQPRIELPFAALGQPGTNAPNVHGYCSTAGGGVSCWYPLPFKERCRVVCVGAEQLYYQINYTTYPRSTKVETFKPGPPEAQLGMEWGTPYDRRATVAPGQTGTLFELRGPSTIRRLALTIEPATLDVLRQLIVKMRWDGHGPSVRVPLLDLFAAGLGPAQCLSAATAVGEWDFFTLDFPLPFQRTGVGELVNTGSEPVKVEATAYATQGRRENDGYFQALYHDAETVAGQPHSVLDIAGRGHYVGTTVTLLGNGDLTFLEGDEQITVDGTTKLLGTGTEDYFDGAWFFRRGAYAEPLAGAPLLQADKTQVSAYRWHLADCIPFTKHLTVDLEHGPGNDAPGCRYRSVAYWYSAQPVSVPAVKAPARPPAFTAKAGDGTLLEAEAQADKVTAEGVTVGVRDDLGSPLAASGGKFLAVRFDQPGASLSLPLRVEETGLYDLVLWLVDGGPSFAFSATLDAEPVPPPVSQASLGDPRLLLGRLRLEAGKHLLRLTADGPADASTPPGTLGIDYVLLESVGKMRGVTEAESLSTKVHGSDAVVVVQTDRDLPPGARRGEKLVGGAVPTEPVWSGGAQLRFAPGEAGDSVDLMFSVDSDGEYGLAASFTREPDAGMVELLLDGRSLLTWSTKADELLVGDRLGLGTHELAAGEHKLTLRGEERDGQVRPVGLDYLLLVPAMRGHETELARVLGDGPTVVKERFGAEPRWSGGAYLRFIAPTESKLSLLAPRAGRYRVTFKEVKLPTGGSHLVSVDGQEAGKLDCAGASEALGQGLTAELRLRRGFNQVTFEDGSGDLALDVIELEYLGGGLPVLPIALGVILLLAIVAWVRKRKTS